MDKFSIKNVLSRFTKQQENVRKENVLLAARKEVDINANGTTGYMIKNGSNKGKVLEHISVKPRNSFQ